MEITYRPGGEMSDEDTAENIALLSREFGDRMYIGAGTVLKKEQVDITKQAGGSFIISPNTDTDIIRYTKEQGLVSVPGAFTPTEIITAHNAGADLIKLFPGSHIDTEYIKAVRTPLPHLKMLAVGGVTVEKIPGYIDVGICGFGISSGIVNMQQLSDGDYEGITRNAEKFVFAVKKCSL